MKLKKFFVPNRTDGEKLLLKMQKQKILVQGLYIALGIALASALIKLFAFAASPSDILTEELVLFVPLLYYAVRQLNSGLESAKHVNVKEAAPILLLLALIAGVCAALLCFGGLFAYSRVADFAFAPAGAGILSGAVGLLTACLFALIVRIVINRNSEKTQ